MLLFDRLPREARELLANASLDYGVETFAGLIKKIGLSAALEQCSKNDKLHSAYAALKDYGPEHPQATDR